MKLEREYLIVCGRAIRGKQSQSHPFTALTQIRFYIYQRNTFAITQQS